MMLEKAKEAYIKIKDLENQALILLKMRDQEFRNIELKFSFDYIYDNDSDEQDPEVLQVLRLQQAMNKLSKTDDLFTMLQDNIYEINNVNEIKDNIIKPFSYDLTDGDHPEISLLKQEAIKIKDDFIKDLSRSLSEKDTGKWTNLSDPVEIHKTKEKMQKMFKNP